MSALQHLLDLVDHDDPFRAAPENLLEMQLAAAEEALQQLVDEGEGLQQALPAQQAAAGKTQFIRPRVVQ